MMVNIQVHSPWIADYVVNKILPRRNFYPNAPSWN